jgi:hypothetical protein
MLGRLAVIAVALLLSAAPTAGAAGTAPGAPGRYSGECGG